MSQGRRLRTHSPYTPPSVSDRDRDPHVAVRRSLPLHVSWRGASAAWSPADSSGCTSTARGACRSIGTGCSGGGLCGSGWSRRSACGSAAAEAVFAPGCSGCSGSRMSAAWLMWRSGIRSRVRGGRTGSSPNSRTIFQSETLPPLLTMKSGAAGIALTWLTVRFLSTDGSSRQKSCRCPSTIRRSAPSSLRGSTRWATSKRGRRSRRSQGSGIGRAVY